MATDSLACGFDSASQVVVAIERLRILQPPRIDASGPHPAVPVARALGHGPSRLPLFAGGAGLAAAAAAYALQQFTVLDYPLQVGGFGLWRFWPFVPLVFISGVLAAGLTAVVGFLAAERLPRLHTDDLGEFLSQRVAAGEWVLRVEVSPGQLAAVREQLAGLQPHWTRTTEVGA